MGKIKTVEILVRGDIIERNIIPKLADRLKESRLRADFSSSVTVPPFLKAVEKHYQSLAVLYATVNIEDLFQFKALLRDLCREEECSILHITEL